MLRQIKSHRESLDKSNPNDLLDVLMIEADENPNLGYRSIATTIIALYLGASDTLTNTMRWLFMVLTEYPDIQEKCYTEIQMSIKTEGEIVTEKCPYLRSVLLENMRWRPVVDTLPHIATEPVDIGGYHIPAKCPVQG